jgi:hypothetical protein
LTAHNVSLKAGLAGVRSDEYLFRCVASYKLHKQYEKRTKVHEEEKKVLITMNQDLQQELEAMKSSVPYIHQVC